MTFRPVNPAATTREDFMTFRVDRRRFLMGSSALLAASLAARPTLAQDNPLRLYWWGGQTRADRTLAVAPA